MRATWWPPSKICKVSTRRRHRVISPQVSSPIMITIPWQCDDNTITMQWQYNDNTMTILWQWDDHTMTMLWQCDDNTMITPVATRVVSCMKMTITDVSNCDQAVSVISYEMIIAMFLRRTKTKCTTDLTVHDKACGDWVYCVLWWPGCHQRAIWNPPSLPVPRVKTSLWGFIIIFFSVICDQMTEPLWRTSFFGYKIRHVLGEVLYKGEP